MQENNDVGTFVKNSSCNWSLLLSFTKISLECAQNSSTLQPIAFLSINFLIDMFITMFITHLYSGISLLVYYGNKSDVKYRNTLARLYRAIYVQRLRLGNSRNQEAISTWRILNSAQKSCPPDTQANISASRIYIDFKISRLNHYYVVFGKSSL